MEPTKVTSFAQDFYEISSTKKETLGMKVTDKYGNVWRYAQAGASALAAGKATVAAQAVANHVNIAVATSAAIGDTRVQVTLGATAATADQYEDGILVVNDATGEGHMYRIKTNPAADASANMWVDLEDPIRVALVAGTSEVTLHANIMKATVISATINNVPVGVAPRVVTATYYYWSLWDGEIPCLASGSEAVGTILCHHTTDGAVQTINTDVDIDNPIVGFQLGTAGVSGEYKLIRYKA